MKRLVIAAALFSLLSGSVYFLYRETTGIVVTECPVADRALAEAFGTARVAHISDLHIRRIGARERKLAALVARLDPDVMFVTGDLVGNNGGVRACVELMGAMARGRTVVAILGNNDHSFKDEFVDTERLCRELQDAGVMVLVNEAAELNIEERKTGAIRRVYVVGLDDNFFWYDDIFKASNNVPREGPKILLAHAPNIIEKVDTRDVNLVLAGHTHGGQISLPLIGAPYTNPSFRAWKKYVSGLYAEYDTLLYVNRGIGTGSIPVRLFARPEITLFDFRR